MKLQNILYGIVLTPIECKTLYKAIKLQEEIQIMTEKELYFKGGMDAYPYFKNMYYINIKPFVISENNKINIIFS